MQEEQRKLLSKQLTHSDINIRTTAVNTISRLQLVEGLELLLASVENEIDPILRAAMCDILAIYISDVRVLALLVHLAFSDPDNAVRWNAIRLLGELAQPSSVEPLLQLLEIENTPESELLPRITKSLGQIGDIRALPALRSLLDSPDTSMFGVEGLSYFSDKASIPLLIEVLKGADNENTDLILYGYHALQKRTGLDDQEIRQMLVSK